MPSQTSPLFPKAHSQPDALAIDDMQHTHSWSELEERVLRIASFLRTHPDLPPRSHVALLMANRCECVELGLGAMLAGLWVTPINHHLTAEEVRYVVADSGAQLLFCDEAHRQLAESSSATQVICVGSELEELLAAASPTALDPADLPGGNMLYTSGTSGHPKGVKRTLPTTLGEALCAWRDMGAALGLDGRGPHLVTGPLYHAAPLAYALWDLLNGAPLVIMPRWDAGRALQLIEAHSVRHTHMVPTMFVRLLQLEEDERARFDTSALTLVLHGAAPITAEVKRRMIEWWGPVLSEYWGATEGGTYTLVSSDQWLAHPGTVGRALPLFDIFARDDAGLRLPPGEVGDLYCLHQHVAQVFEYHGAPDKTRAAHPEPHLFTAGDIGYLDEEGFVYLCDRKSNTIISGGVNIYPAEIEQVLAAHPAVGDVAVFGIPDPEWGEQVKAVVELTPGCEKLPGSELEAELLALAAQHLAKHKLPRSIDFSKALPRLPTGKLRVRELRDPYWEELGRKI